MSGYSVGARVRYYEAGEVRDEGTVTEIREDVEPYRVKWDEAPFSTYDQWYRPTELVPVRSQCIEEGT